MKKIAAVVVTALALVLAGCTSDAEVASTNLSKDADNFKILRRIIFFNGFTDTYLLSIEGYCSIKDETTQLEVTCKTEGNEQFKKHFMGLSANASYFVEQINSANVSTGHYKVVFKPSTIVPDVEVR